MARRAASPSGRRFSLSAEASREARENRLRRAGWEPGEPYPLVDAGAFLPVVEPEPWNPSFDSLSGTFDSAVVTFDQTLQPEPTSDFSPEFSGEFF
jgi:hypothetical protein